MDREKEFYGEEDDYRLNHTIPEQIENEDEVSDEDDDMLDRNEQKTIKLKEYNQYGEHEDQYHQDSDDTEDEIGKILGET